MSRDQKPARVKLVASSTTNYGRRLEDQMPREEAGSLSAGAGAANVPTARKGSALLLSSLFLVACAAGGAGMVFLGFAGS